MDNRTIRTLIVELRDNSDEPKSFSQISKILLDKYEVHKDRQSVCGIYNRAKKNEEVEVQKYDSGCTVDVINLTVMGYNMTEITTLASKFGHTLSYFNVRDLLSREEAYLKTAQQELIYKIAKMLSEKTELETIKKKLVYKDTTIKEKKWVEALAAAYYFQITNIVLEELARIYKEVGAETTKEVIKHIELDIPLSEVKLRVKA